MATAEITALARVLGDLDYYELLHLAPDAKPGDVRLAYHATSRAFHPDANRQQCPEIRNAIHQIAKRVTEAYSVLRSPQRREAYNRHLSSGAGVRMQLSEAEAASNREQAEKRQGRTPQGRQYFNLAVADLRRGDFAAGVRNLQTALTFEPGNTFFKDQLAQAREKLDPKR